MNVDRSELAARHLDLARKAASLYYPRVRAHVSYDDLVAMASVGLSEAASRFDPAVGASFKTFAWYRVQGAILDGLRKETALPRAVWARIVTLRATASYLEAQAQRASAAKDKAQAATTADKLREVRAALGAIRTMYTVSIHQLEPDSFRSTESAPDDALARERQKQALSAALATLPEKERQLMHKHYVEGKSLLDAGAELGMSKSWASRLHARAVDQLRARLADTG
ncbi:MAG TPA: sigma-70 family RNA polymerase sigma factor [Kofleriaceae bacterium]|nr:sigma-70 family RNA polymerase sigma factor [Kofleriaceae bacterium]